MISFIGVFILKEYVKYKIDSIEEYPDLLSQIFIPTDYFVKYFSFYLIVLTLVPLAVLFYKKRTKQNAFKIAAILCLVLFVVLDFAWLYLIFYPS